jgi:SAM-dependent methyltransferase
MDPEVIRRRSLEDEFWRTSETERPDVDSLENILNKTQDAAVFVEALESYRPILESARTILEIGAGQGWASCIVKRLVPEASVVASDLSPHAVASVPKWERIYDVALDGARHYPSDELGERDSSFDLIFCFAAAHHFVRHRTALAEIHRVLTPGGHALYLYEPSCGSVVYPLAIRRVTAKRPEVPEDVLKHERIRELAGEVGLECTVDFFPSITRRGSVETFYYAMLRRVSPLQRVLPCTANYRFRKPDPSGAGAPRGEISTRH